MKEFRVINIMDTMMQITNQRVAVIELAEVSYEDFSLTSGLHPYTFGTEGERFVIEFNSFLNQRVMQSAKDEEIIELDMSDFHSRIEQKNGRPENIYYHINVKLLDK